jgi:hypothetical protein
MYSNMLSQREPMKLISPKSRTNRAINIKRETITMSCSRRQLFVLAVLVLVVFMVALNAFENAHPRIWTFSEIAKASKQNTKSKDEHKDQFVYDRERRNKNSPRIAVLAGPHKTASTSIQNFFSKIAGSTVRLTNTPIIHTGKDNVLEPHPTITEWVMPIGVMEEYDTESSLGGGFHHM